MNEIGSVSRREFAKAAVATALSASFATEKSVYAKGDSARLRMGGPVKAKDPQDWVRTLKSLGYRAAYCPVKANETDDVVSAYAKAAKEADIVIAEVGAWSNPLSPDQETRRKALAKCREQLALADRIGARCCVNISGSRGQQWAGHHKDNLTKETFDLIVETTRAIIDDVKPARTFFALETMPWAYPDSPDSYLRLLKAIDRRHFAVHLDPVNLVCSPQRYYGNSKLIRECFRKLGPHIKSCHAKDIILDTKFTTHLDEIRPGLGGLDYETFLRELSSFPDTPLMLEHLKTQEQYRQAADHIRSVAQKAGLSFV